MIEFPCPDCGKRLKTSDERAGATARCPQCGSSLTVPIDAITSRSNPSEAAADFGPISTTDQSLDDEASFAGGENACPMCGATNDSTSSRCYACGENLWSTASGRALRPNDLSFGSVWRTAWERWTINLGLSVAAAAIGGGLLFLAYLVTVFVIMAAVIGLGLGGGAQYETEALIVILAVMSLGYLFWFFIYAYLLAGLSNLTLLMLRQRSATLGAMFLSVGRAAPSLTCTFAIVLGLLIAMLPGGGLYLFGIIMTEQNETAGVLVAILGYLGLFLGWGLGWTFFWPVHFFIADGQRSLLAPLIAGVRLAFSNLRLSFFLALVHTGLLLAGLLTCYVGLLFSMPLSFLLSASAYERLVRTRRAI